MSVHALECGKWMQFDPGTCFGNDIMHYGTILGIDFEIEEACVVINATSQVGKCERFAERKKLSTEAIVVVEPNDPEPGMFFPKKTAFDCNRIKRYPIRIIEAWIEEGKIRATGDIVKKEFLKKLRDSIPVGGEVSPMTRRIARGTNG